MNALSAVYRFEELLAGCQDSVYKVLNSKQMKLHALFIVFKSQYPQFTWPFGAAFNQISGTLTVCWINYICLFRI